MTMNNPLPFDESKSPEPVTQADVDALRGDMELLRDSLGDNRRMNERQVWPLLDRAGQLLERAEGSSFEEQLQRVYGLLSAIWATVRNQEKIRRAIGK